MFMQDWPVSPPERAWRAGRGGLEEASGVGSGSGSGRFQGRSGVDIAAVIRRWLVAGRRQHDALDGEQSLVDLAEGDLDAAPAARRKPPRLVSSRSMRPLGSARTSGALTPAIWAESRPTSTTTIPRIHFVSLLPGPNHPVPHAFEGAAARRASRADWPVPAGCGRHRDGGHRQQRLSDIAVAARPPHAADLEGPYKKRKSSWPRSVIWWSTR